MDHTGSILWKKPPTLMCIHSNVMMRLDNLLDKDLSIQSFERPLSQSVQKIIAIL